MLDFFKRKNKPKQTDSSSDEKKIDAVQSAEDSSDSPPSLTESPVLSEQITDKKETSKPSFLNRLKASLTKTRTKLSGGIADLILGKKVLDLDLMEKLESQLLSSDVGSAATDQIIEKLTQGISRKTLQNPESVFKALQDELENILNPCEVSLKLHDADTPFVILMVGVNGAGKTTSIGKLAKYYQSQNVSVMLAAGDTFRAAAVEQLQIWGQRMNLPVVAQQTGADSASVLFDAFQSAKAKGINLLIADTAGRLHTRDNLMDELKKIKRVIQKLDAHAPHEILLVLDATTGQNGLKQAEIFKKEIGVTGLAITKLDGTAKGGVLFAIASQLKLPIRFIGVGETADDLRPFKAQEFVSALFSMDEKM